MSFRRLHILGWSPALWASSIFSLVALSCSGDEGPTKGSENHATGGLTHEEGTGAADFGGANSGGSGSGSASSGSSSAGGADSGGTPVGGGASGGAGGLASDGEGSGGDNLGGMSGEVVQCEIAGTPVHESVACHSDAECGGGLVKCCQWGNCWGPEACPIPPDACPTTEPVCTTDDDCDTGGTCVTWVAGCPQCQQSRCDYPPPTCLDQPDICGTIGECQPDGSCAPIQCTEGYDCNKLDRCNPQGIGADPHGCQRISCDEEEGPECSVNQRCTPPADPTVQLPSCLAIKCTVDSECDCGYCVHGACAAILGICTPAPS